CPSSQTTQASPVPPQQQAPVSRSHTASPLHATASHLSRAPLQIQSPSSFTQACPVSHTGPVSVPQWQALSSGLQTEFCGQFTPLHGSSTQTPSTQLSLSAQISPPHLQRPSVESQVCPSGQAWPAHGSGTPQRFWTQISPSEQVVAPHLHTPSVGSQVSLRSQPTPTQRSSVQKGTPSAVTTQTSFDLQIMRESPVPHLHTPSEGSQVKGAAQSTPSQRLFPSVSSPSHAAPRAATTAVSAAMRSQRCMDFI